MRGRGETVLCGIPSHQEHRGELSFGLTPSLPSTPHKAILCPFSKTFLPEVRLLLAVWAGLPAGEVELERGPPPPAGSPRGSYCLNTKVGGGGFCLHLLHACGPCGSQCPAVWETQWSLGTKPLVAHCRDGETRAADRSSGGGGGLEGARKKEGPQLRQQHLGLKAENKESLKKEVRRGSSRPRGTHRRLRASEKFQKLFLISPGLRLEREPQGEHTLRGAHLGRRGAEP